MRACNIGVLPGVGVAFIELRFQPFYLFESGGIRDVEEVIGDDGLMKEVIKDAGRFQINESAPGKDRRIDHRTQPRLAVWGIRRQIEDIVDPTLL